MVKYSLKQVIGTLTIAERMGVIVTNDLPARLTVAQAARILGFPADTIPILIESNLLEPLGSPVQNAQKYFSNVYIRALAADGEWLDKATQAVYDYWKKKNERKTINLAPVAQAA